MPLPSTTSLRLVCADSWLIHHPAFQPRPIGSRNSQGRMGMRHHGDRATLLKRSCDLFLCFNHRWLQRAGGRQSSLTAQQVCHRCATAAAACAFEIAADFWAVAPWPIFRRDQDLCTCTETMPLFRICEIRYILRHIYIRSILRYISEPKGVI